MTIRTRSILFALTAATAAPQLDAQGYAAFVFDRSGSMNTVRSGSSTTRADFSQQVGLDDVAFFFFLNNVILLRPASCIVLEYHGSTVTQLGGVYTTAASAQAAITGLPAPSGSTPLAAALCEATGLLENLNLGASPDQRTLYVYSDGEENSSPVSSCRAGLPFATSGDHCSDQFPGPTGAFSSGSWQEAVCSIIHAKVTTNFYYFSDFTDVVGPEVFFGALCNMTGGNLTNIDDTSTIPPQNPWQTMGVGCDDFHGTTLSMTHDGLPQIGSTVAIGCRTSAPLPYVLGVGFSRTSYGGSPLPISLAAYGAPGCSIYSSWDIPLGFVQWNSTHAFAVPNSPAYVGLPLYFQAAQMHPLNNSLGVSTSNLLRMKLVP